MPEAFPATVAEREAELVALQGAFDEYIASSRELEEELDAELAKMQEKLAESTSANAALSAQLENISPQLTSLENALSESRRKLKEEQKLRRAAEQAQDEADQRLREMEQSIQHVREECDVVHEELAFKENELEESRLELEVEKQRLENQLSAVRKALEQAEAKAARCSDMLESSNLGTVSEEERVERAPVASTAHTVNDEYVKKLEDELEMVTEQLIEMEKRLSDSEVELNDKKAIILDLELAGCREEDEELIRNLQTENADRLESEQKLREELELTKEDLVLLKEEVHLQQEELHAFEEDSKNTAMKIEEERVKHREEINKLKIQMNEVDIAAKSGLGEAALIASTVQQANEENERLNMEVAGLEAALKTAREDYQNVIEELEDVNARFDAARDEARREGHESITEELRAEMKRDVSFEIAEMKEQLATLSKENVALQRQVDDTELALAAAKDSHTNSNVRAVSASSAVVEQLQSQLSRAKDDLAKKDKEAIALNTTLEERITKAEQDVTRLESELHSAKAHLAESEARVIVLRREKDRNGNAMPSSLTKKQSSSDRRSGKGLALSSSVSQDGSIDRSELSSMDPEMAPRMMRTPTKNRPRSTSPSSVMRLEYKLTEEEKKYKDLQKQHDTLQDQKRMGEVRIKRLEEDLRILQKELFGNGGDTAVVTQMTRLSSLAGNQRAEQDASFMISDETASKRLDGIIQSRDVKMMSEELKTLEKKCNSQRDYNAQLLSKMLHLQGNIQVYCRVRPMTITELQKGHKSTVESLSETEVGCFDGRTNKWKSFAFDRVWGPDQSQQSVFQDVEPLALSVVDGFNACIFAYGQTGSGKTFTMEGTEENSQYGISYRTIQKIFHLLQLRAQQQRAAEMFVGNEKDDGPAKEVEFSFSLELGMLEIYNDEVYDLLGTQGASMKEKQEGAMKAGGKASLDIRRNKDGRIEVPNLTRESVQSIQEVMELLKRGNSNRATASTDMNEHSSRSHMVLSVDVYSGLEDSQKNKGTLYLVDLAGSERVRKSNVQGDQLKEAGYINKSLSALGNVMEALDRKASHVPYRDSKLTYLLQDSLGGNSRTMMVVAICPTDSSYDESVHALQFATRVRRIQIGAAQRNVTSKNLEETVKGLTDEMRALTRAKERTEGQLHSLKRDNNRVQEKLQNLSKNRAQGKSDSKTLDVLRKNNDDMAARWQKEKVAREEATEELEKARKELRSLQQQFGKSKGTLAALERKLEEKEEELESATKQLRQAGVAVSAASHRARREQVLSGRTNPAVYSTGATSTPSRSSTSKDNTPGTPISGNVTAIRAKVLALLEQYDTAKVDRIDIIMDKFKGKEALLLEKMTQRYEQSSPASPSSSIQQRNQVALERHRERMEKIREKKSNGGIK
jgi:kinesin family protein C2/C3